MRNKKSFWENVEIKGPDECWEWQGVRNKDGYGKYRNKLYSDDGMKSHRLAYVLSKGGLIDDKEICHSCDNPPCVNPKHLFMGTHKDNMRDAARKGRIISTGDHHNKYKTHCPNGHEYIEGNMYIYEGSRKCKICIGIRSSRQRDIIRQEKLKNKETSK